MNHWTLSHIMHLKLRWISEKNTILTEKQTMICFGAQLNFDFFSNRRTLKFLKMKCNPTNRNIVTIMVGLY